MEQSNNLLMQFQVKLVHLGYRFGTIRVLNFLQFKILLPLHLLLRQVSN